MDDAKRPEPTVGQDTHEGLVEPGMTVDDHRLSTPDPEPHDPDAVLGEPPRGEPAGEATPAPPADASDVVTDAARRLAPGQEYSTGEG